MLIKELKCFYNKKITCKNGKLMQKGSLNKQFFFNENMNIKYQNYMYFGDKEIKDYIFNVELGMIEISEYQGKKIFNVIIKDFSTETLISELEQKEAEKVIDELDEIDWSVV